MIDLIANARALIDQYGLEQAYAELIVLDDYDKPCRACIVGLLAMAVGFTPVYILAKEFQVGTTPATNYFAAAIDERLGCKLMLSGSDGKRDDSYLFPNEFEVFATDLYIDNDNRIPFDVLLDHVESKQKELCQ